MTSQKDGEKILAAKSECSIQQKFFPRIQVNKDVFRQMKLKISKRASRKGNTKLKGKSKSISERTSKIQQKMSWRRQTT